MLGVLAVTDGAEGHGGEGEPDQLESRGREARRVADTEESMLNVGSGGAEIFWGVSRVWFPMSRVSEIWTARREGQGWGAAGRAPFSFGYSDGDPFVAADGQRVYFASIRPVRGPRKDFDLYVVERGLGSARARCGELFSCLDRIVHAALPTG